MATPLALVWDLIAKDSASPAFLRVAGAADKAATATERSMRSIEGASARMSAVGAKMTKGITLPLLGIGAVAVDQAAKFQKSMTLIQTAGGETAAKTAIISAGIKKVAVDTGTSLSALSDGIYTVAKAGAQKWSATDQLLVLKAAAQGAKAENVDLGTAVNALTSVMQSYGVKAKDAVGVENELIKGSGLAKTSFGEFTGSLSNFVPLASSLHISLAQVTGALATMTQHGESAQQSGQNLNNLIRNLAGGNTVASKAMQQLNIDTVSLRKNLSENGLTGTLNIVENALAKNSKGGLVVVDAFKRAQLATGSLTTELNAMPSSLQSISKQFETGKLGYKDYYADVKQLGGTQFELGKNFITTMSAAKGFSDQLKSGNGTISTAAQQLQKMLGGATGLNVALMLGGNSAKQFSANVDQIAAAANKAGVNVLGWGKTSQTLSVQLDKAKENLQVLAVEIGTALIPAVTKIASAVSGAVHWFSSLSSTQKEVIGWSAGVLAALGPVMSIGGRLTRAAAGLASFAGASEATAGRVALSTQRIGAALAGIGLVYGSTQTGGIAGHIMGALGGGLTGASIGSFFGPLGTAIGGIGGALAGLGVSYLHSGDAATAASKAAKAALASQQTAAEQLEGSLESVAAAYNSQYKAAIAQNLTKTNVGGSNFNVLGIAQNAGINPQAIVQQAIGSGSAKGLDSIAASLRNAMLAGKITEPEMDAVNTAIGLVGGSAAKAEKNIELQNAALGRGVVPANQLGTSLKKLREAMSGTGTALNQSSAAGLRNTAVIAQNVGAINKSITAARLHKEGVAAVASAYESQINSLRSNLVEMGFQGPALDKIIAKYAHIPKSVATELIKRGVLPADIQAIISKYNLIPKSKSTTVAVKDHASSALIAIQGHLAGIHDKSITVSVGYNTNDGIKLAGTGKVLKAAGGYISGPGSGTSDSIPAMLSNGEYVINAAQTAKYRSLLSAINSGTRGFAAGGAVGSKHVTLPDGTVVASETAAHNAIARSLTALAGALPKFTASLTKTTDQMKTAEAALLKDVKASGESKSILNKITDDFGKLNALATKRDALQAQLGTPDKAATQTAYEKLTDALSTYTGEISTVAQAITSGFNITTAGTSGTPSIAYQRALARSQGGGAPMPGDEALLASGGGADGTSTAVSVAQIISGLKGQLGDATTFRSELAKITKEGLAPSLVQQLAEAGVSGGGATVDALATQATAAQIRQITKLGSDLNKVATGTGTDVAKTVDGAEMTHDQAVVNGLLSLEKTLGRKIDAIGSDVASALNGVASKSHQKARAKQ